MRYEVDAGGHRVRIEATPDGRVLVGDRVVAHDAREIVPGAHWSIVVEGRAHEVVLLGGDPPRMRVDGREAVVVAYDERTLAARQDRALAGGGRHEVRAPMPGLLKAVHVREGDVVERNDALATLEAMKMENELRAPARAKVQRIAAAAGTKVESGALIAVLVDEPV
jgi:3-methylcrotonyl-CoA carboxylase alpha subunit